MIPIISFHPRGSKDDSKDKLWLLEVDPNGGDIAKKIPIKGLSGTKISLTTASSFVSSITVSENNDVTLVGKFDSFALPASITKISRVGNTNKAFKFPNQNNSEKEFSQVIGRTNFSSSNLLLIGKNKSSITNVNSEGVVLWERSYKIGQKYGDWFSDGVVIGDKGDFVVVGCSADPAKPKSPYPDVMCDDFIVRCNGQGDVAATDIFPGNPWPGEQPLVCQTGSGNFVVAFGKSMAMSNINIRGYSPDLKLLWEKPVIKSEGNKPSSFKIAAIPNNGFVLATNVDFGNLRIYEYDEKGNQVTSFSMDREVWLGNIGLTCMDNKAIVIYQTRPNFGQGEELRRIKIVALELK